MNFPARQAAAAPVLLGALLLVAGCNQQRLILCPGAAILADTAKETVFRPGAPKDLSGVAFTASMSQVKNSCVYEQRDGLTYSDLEISFRAVRPPSADAARYTLTYFVSVNSADRVLSKKMYTVRFDFAPGAAVSTVDETVPRTMLSLERGLIPTDYQYLTGFQLTAEQLDFNRNMGRFVP